MFGESTIIGHKTISILNNRISLPSFTGAVIGEQVYMQLEVNSNLDTHSSSFHHLNIYSKDEFEKRLERFSIALKEAYDSKRINYEQYYNYQRYYYGLLSFMPETIDKQNRIHLESRIIDELHLNKQVYVVGNQKHLELYPSEPINKLSL